VLLEQEEDSVMVMGVERVALTVAAEAAVGVERREGVDRLALI
jgi:hypothetical protein